MAKEKLKQEEKKKLNKQNFKKLLGIFQYILPYQSKFTLGIICLVIGSFFLLAFPFLSGKLIDVANGEDDWYLTEINSIALILTAILFVQGILSYFRVYLFAIVSENAMADVRTSLYKKIICLPITFFDKVRTGDLMSRISSDVSLLQTTFSTTLAELIRQTITLLFGIIMIFVTTPKLSLFMLAILPILIVAAMLFGKKIRVLSRHSQDELAKSTSIVEETFTSILAVKIFTNENFEKSRYTQAIQKVVVAALAAAKYRAGLISFIIFALFGALVAIMWYGAVLLQEGQIGVGDLISFVLYTAFIGGSIAGLGDLFGQLQRAIGSAERILEIHSEEMETDGQGNEGLQLKGKISFEGVNFSYPTRQDNSVLKGFDLSIETGQKIALVGKSGAGKTTVTQLLMRLYDEYEGTISVDNQATQDYNLSSFRANIGVVPQDVVLFGGTISENIAYGKPTATDEEIREAARQANALEFIESFSDQFDTLVGERGVKLSGGQRQRIAIARTILKNPSILVLDEATSALDAESEKEVQAALSTLMQGRTSIIIAHRLTTIKSVDKIFVLDGGRVVESGSHDDLLRLDNGMYRKLVNLQVFKG